MVLEQLKYGASRHMIEDEGTKRLLFILCLPLVDGVFATLLVTGAISTFSGILAVALTVFTGAGAVAVLYSHADSKQQAKRMVGEVAPYLLAGALAVSLVAPVFEQLFHIERLRYAAGLALLVIASKMYGLRFSDKLSVPAILLTGVVLSVKNPGALVLSLEYVLPAVATVTVAIIGLYGAAAIGTDRMNLEYVRKGGAVVLVTIAASMYGLNVPSELGLAVFAASVVVSLRA